MDRGASAMRAGRNDVQASFATYGSHRYARDERFLFQSVFLQPAIELGAGQSKPLGRARLVAAALAEHLDDRLALNRAQIGGGRRRPAVSLRCRAASAPR